MLSIGLGHYLTLAAIIFIIGIVGIFLNRKNIIVILMSIELILLAVNINLVSFSIYIENETKFIFTARSISSMLINITMIFFLFKKMPTIPIINIIAARVK